MKNDTEKMGREIDLQWFVLNLLIHWKWFVLSVVLFLGLAFTYLRYKEKVYGVNARIVLKDNKRGGLSNSELSVFEGMGLLNSNNNVDNEIEILRSRNLVEDVVRELSLYTSYRVQGRFIHTELYGNRNPYYYRSVPVRVYADPELLSKLRRVLELEVSLQKDAYLVKGSYGDIDFESSVSSLPAVVSTPAGELMLQPSPHSSLREKYPLTVNILPPVAVAKNYVARLGVESVSKTSSVVKLALKETHRGRGEDFLRKLIEMYNQDAMKDKNRAASNAAAFIDERLAYINEDLKASETDIENYKRENRLTNFLSQSNLLVNEDNEYEKQLLKMGMQIELFSYLEKALKQSKSESNLLPATLGITDPGLNSLIGRYNQAVLEKERLLSYSSEEAPLIRRLDERIIGVREDIEANIAGLRMSYKTQEKGLKAQAGRYDSHLGDMPRKEREVTEMVRQQQIKASLYMLLLQKKEEAELSLAVTAPSAKVMEYPLAGGVPIAPRKNLVYAFFLLLGVGFPFALLGVRELVNYKIEDEQDVRQYARVPIIVSLPQDKSRKPVVVSPHSTSAITERFRLLRTNLQFLLDDPQKKVILVTSTLSGEGKTFISINLAMTFALKYKTLLVGLDMRRPKLNKYMDLPQKDGVVSYLNGDVMDLDEIIHENIGASGLDVLVSGVIPPNPNELLMEESLSRLFSELRKRYEYIIVDTSPVGSVSDTFLLNPVADATLFVIRKNHSPKTALSLANSIQDEQRLNNLQIVLNGFNPKGSRYGYGYGYGYGYSSDGNKQN